MARKPIHGDAFEGKRTRLYDIWRGIRQRCNNPKATNYKDYGGRGITVSPSWDTYLAFREWAMSSGYQDVLSIERRDVDGIYEPSNCYWADSTTQACNKRKRTHANRTSEFIGVSTNKKGWSAGVQYKGKLVHLGTYPTAIEAATVRDAYIKANQLPHKLNF